MSMCSSAPAAGPTDAAFHAADVLCARVDAIGSATCVGLDPVVEKLPPAIAPKDIADRAQCVAAIEEFSREIVATVAKAAAAVKIQAACFERYGPDGFAAMWRVLEDASRSGLVTLLDFKRGDIGISAEHYAASARAAHAHWTTISAYLGSDGIAPFLGEGRGSFALVRTSNPSGDALQALPLADGRTVAEAVADMVAELGRPSVGASGFSCLGAVVGATKRAEISSLRARMPNTVFLVPGYGAQGGTADDVRACFTSGHQGALITASRSVIYPKWTAGTPWTKAVLDAARVFADEIRAITGQGR
ncbi:MAG: orotidine-5'-phosphate decarboxylase [Phycisphaerales bacterium]